MTNASPPAVQQGPDADELLSRLQTCRDLTRLAREHGAVPATQRLTGARLARCQEAGCQAGRRMRGRLRQLTRPCSGTLQGAHPSHHDSPEKRIGADHRWVGADLSCVRRGKQNAYVSQGS